MCGICGTVAIDPQQGVGERDVAALDPMLARMTHRGPDGEGRLIEPTLAAGMRRLAVIDLAGGDQPLSNEDGRVRVVFNGEIYNHRELRAELERAGHRFRTRSDTEVLVHLWEEHGAALLDRLNGMFALCLHDARANETLIARDRLGIKPLYLHRTDRRLVFASEVPVLLRHPDVRAELDDEALLELFCLQYLSGDRTLWRGIRKLLPGHAVHLRDGELREYRWYRPAEPGGLPEEDDPTGRLRERLTDSVRLRRIADVPLGVFLSGGIDSSAIAATLVDLAADSQAVETFSVGFEETTAALDERAQARAVATHLGTKHHELLLSPTGIASELPRLVEHLGEPVLDPALIPTYLLSRFARERVTVALSGEGADELFAGYRRYAYQHRFGWIGRVPGIGRFSGREAVGRVLPGRVGQALEAVTLRDPARSHLRWSQVMGRGLARRLFGEAAHDAFETRVATAFAAYFDGGTGAGGIRLEDQLRADRAEWLPHDLLAKVDLATMACSLEARVPFLDHRLVEWAASLPAGLKIRNGTTKFVLREAFRGRLPDEILDRPKRGFDLPLAGWLRGPLYEAAQDRLRSPSLSLWRALDRRAVIEMLDRHREGRQDFGLPLFNLLSIALFLEQVASDAPARADA